ncbi:protein phosphatase 2c (macronuclear) [Tetrahymena thermophila SB210]|uniref:Protein phosphatase 2c n=1 Tax=Tetrahymena thermophila (strain SB210) TaxID=312017 RepID=Q22UQ1_TETTS|nr:protein phosphatase 2c [Tetrahymena thermophila SB210]EAR88919.2 protein phosphatase 2c [Tetrahymena thermophila SB210]|eukprot:XP_001009164.2 protein phosphatase 2c [Tetrahymena thermophila SB210]
MNNYQVGPFQQNQNQIHSQDQQHLHADEKQELLMATQNQKESFIASEKLQQKKSKKNRSLSQLRNYRPAISINQNLKGDIRQKQDENARPQQMYNLNNNNKSFNGQINSHHQIDDTYQIQADSVQQQNQQLQQFSEELFSSNLSHRLKSQGKLIGLQRMRSQQTQKQIISAAQPNGQNNVYSQNQQQIQGSSFNSSNNSNMINQHNMALVNALQNGIMSSRLSNTQRNYHIQQIHNNSNNQHQQTNQNNVKSKNINNFYSFSLNNTNNNSFSDENTENIQSNNGSQNIQNVNNNINNTNQQIQVSNVNNYRQSASTSRNSQNNLNDKTHNQLSKQHSHYSSNGKHTSFNNSNNNNNSGDLNMFRRSMNRIYQKPQSSSQQQQSQGQQQQQNNSSRVLQVNKLFQNESFQIPEGQKKFFNNLSSSINIQQIEGMQFPKSARKVLLGSSQMTHFNGLKADQQAFLPPLIDQSNEKNHQEQNFVNNQLDEQAQSSFIPQNNTNTTDSENNVPFNHFSNSVSQPRSQSNSRSNLSNKVQTRSLSRQSMNNQSNLNKNNNDADKSVTNERQTNMNTSQNGLSFNSSQASSQMRKNSKKNSLNNIVKNIYNNTNIQKAEQPKVLSPTKNKSQNVFKIQSVENKSINQGVSALSNSNTNGVINNNQNPSNTFNQNVSSYYPILNSRKQSTSSIPQNDNTNQESAQNQTTGIQNIMDDSVEEYLEFNQIPNIDPSKTSQKSLGIITAYGANTHQGIVRNYNEDRVSIILNMAKPKDKPEDLVWPNVSFFAVYDGHGGSSCAEFLRDNLHYYIIRDENFPSNPKLAIQKGFEKIEDTYIEKADSGPFLDKSGSCAVVALFVEKTVYIANVGDSRAILSSNFGKNQQDLSEDHKPSLPSEEQRITSLGGHIYQSVIPIYGSVNGNNIQQIQDVIKGPHRAFPGRLAVSRTIGDAEAKLPKYGGIKGVISAEPEIQVFEIQDNHDFVFLGCDGIFDKMTSKEAIQCCWQITDQCKNQHEFVGRAIENTMRQSMMKKSYDNVTVVLVGLKNLEYYFQKHIK